jgi:hypothetical protein
MRSYLSAVSSIPIIRWAATGVAFRTGRHRRRRVYREAPCGGDKAGPSPVDRRKGGLKRSVATEDAGVPLGVVSAGANRHDSPLLGPTLQAATTQVGPATRPLV